jgi:hypothetical protein
LLLRSKAQTVTRSTSVRKRPSFAITHNAELLFTALNVACMSIRVRNMLDELGPAQSYTISLVEVRNLVKPFSMMELTVDRLHVTCFTLSLTGARIMRTAQSPSAKALTQDLYHGKNASSAISITLPFSISNELLKIWISVIYLQSAVSLLASMTVHYLGARTCDFESCDEDRGRRVRVSHSQTSVATQPVAIRTNSEFQ